METDKEYKVIYNDDKQTKTKDLVFKKSENGLVFFFNAHNNLEEIIPVHSIVRIQGKKESDTNERRANI